MRIIAGRYRGKKLKAPKGLATRPVLARVREALFAVLGDIGGVRFLDLFAGTGAIGIEALSRGAGPVVFVELGAPQCRIINDNLPETTEQTRVFRTDAFRALKRLIAEGALFDIVFADPPYDKGLSQQTVELVCAGNILDADGLLVVTSRSTEILPTSSGDFGILQERRYGDTKLTIYGRKDDTQES